MRTEGDPQRSAFAASYAKKSEKPAEKVLLTPIGMTQEEIAKKKAQDLFQPLGKTQEQELFKELGKTQEEKAKDLFQPLGMTQEEKAKDMFKPLGDTQEQELEKVIQDSIVQMGMRNMTKSRRKYKELMRKVRGED
jgi:hypothetical protein